MVVAGNETTTKLLGHCWYWALAQPRPAGEPACRAAPRVPRWVEETLRYDASSQVLARTAVDRRRAARRTDPGGRAGAAAGRLRQPRRAGLRRARPLRPRPRHRRAAQLRQRPALLPGRLARAARGAHRPGAAARAVADYDIDEYGARRVHSVNVRGFAQLPTTVTRDEPRCASTRATARPSVTGRLVGDRRGNGAALGAPVTPSSSVPAGSTCCERIAAEIRAAGGTAARSRARPRATTRQIASFAKQRRGRWSADRGPGLQRRDMQPGDAMSADRRVLRAPVRRQPPRRARG